MTTITLHRIGLIVGLVAIAGKVAWAAPPPIMYQGQVKIDGEPVNNSADFRFRIWDDLTGGSVVASVRSVANVPIVNGLFTVPLDTDPVPNVLFAAYPRYLEIQVAVPSGSSFEILSPRQLITPAPVAYYALEAPTSGGGSSPWQTSGSDIYYTAGDVGIGTNGPGAPLHVVSDADPVVFAESTATANFTSAIAGRTDAGNGWAIYGHATAGSGNATGGHFVTDSTGGFAVHGIANNGNGLAKGGYFESYASMGLGVYGRNRSTTGSGAHGVYGRTDSDAARGVLGEATSPIGATYGVYGLSASNSGRGVFGEVSSLSGSTWGVWGRSASTSGRGVFGEAVASSGSTYGVEGYAQSPTGFAIYGFNEAGSGSAIAVMGETASPDGFGGYFQGKGYFSDFLGLGTNTPEVPLDVVGANNWDLNNTEGDFRLGNSSYRMKMSVSLAGAGAGNVRMRAQGGSHKLILGSNLSDVATISEANGGSVGINTTNPDYSLHVIAPSGGRGGYAEGGSYGFYGSGTTAGVRGMGGTYGVYGSSASGVGVYGYGTNDPGVQAMGHGTGTANPALFVENLDPNGISVFSRSASSDANAVFVNRGAGPLIKGFTGPTGGNLVFQVTNDGTTITNVLQINGGSDLAENFDVVEAAEPGTVVAIDPERPGKLKVARGAYNRRVAGVISGANDLDVGMVLADLPGAENSRPVALSGRVWVRCEAVEKAVEPGDLLTTAERAGHAMPVTDYARAHGTVIGKAMTALPHGEIGMVLVLVNLQ